MAPRQFFKITPGEWVTPTVRLVRKLGDGGMSSLWVAAHMKFHTQVIVKFLARHLLRDKIARQRFQREATVTKRVHCPHLVQVFESGETPDGTPFMVMEWLDGETLSDRLKSHGALSPQTALLLVQQLGQSLGKVHAAGVVHRDLKTDNIFVLRHPEQFLIKLLDFGVAKVAEGHHSITDTNQTLGTPAYMSPEQLRDPSNTDERSDIWSLGVVTYYSLFTERPFVGADYPAVCFAICAGTFRLPSDRDTNLAPFDSWFRTVFALDPAGRFGDVKAAVESFRTAIAAIAAGKLVEVTGPDDTIDEDTLDA